MIIELLAETAVTYVVVLLGIRLMGKRQLGEMEASELVIAFLISEFAILPITNHELPFFYGPLAVLFLASLEIFSSLTIQKWNKAKKLATGKMSLIIDNYYIDQNEIKKLRMSVEEFVSELRIAGYSDIATVRYAIIETNGKLSVISSDDIFYNIISDGTISQKGLDKINQNTIWLYEKLTEYNIKSHQDVYLMQTTPNGKIFIVPKTPTP